MERTKTGNQNNNLNEALKNYIVEPYFKDMENTVAVTFSSSDFYAPYLSALLLSLVAHTSKGTNYDIVVFTRDMTLDNQKYLKSLIEKENVSLRFLNVAELFEGKGIYVPLHVPSVTLETYFRILAPLVFAKYPKVIFMDSDTLILSDLKELYNTDITGHPLAAAEELLFQAAFNEARRSIAEFLEKLRLSDARRYFQGGVILFNCDYCNKHHVSEQLLHNITTRTYEMVDQDAMNELCANRHLLIGNEWNYAPCKKSSHFLQFMPDDVKHKYLSITEPKIVHFIGMYWKPWLEVENKYDHIWWSYARQTIYYEEILYRLCENMVQRKLKDVNETNGHTITVLSQQMGLCFKLSRNKRRFLYYKIMSKITFGKKHKKYKAKYKRLKWEIKEAKRILRCWGGF